jgi:hypothetical protein
MCSIDPPAGFAIPGIAQQKFQYSCKAASIPEATVGQVEVGYMGRRLKYSGDRTWADWEATVILDQDYAVRDLFEAWLDAINAVEDNVMADGVKYTNYKSSVDIMHLSQLDTDAPIAQYHLVGAWPSFVGPIQLGWENQNQISEFTVRFAFDDMTRIGTNLISGFALGSSATGNTAGIIIPTGGAG